jgi:triacylglycerol lipase
MFSMRFPRTTPLLVAVAFTLLCSPAAAREPKLSTPPSAVSAAMTCNGELDGAKRPPVLLVHGTFANSDINWSWNYQAVLPGRGETACAVDLPDLAAGDAQLSTEYVVRAIRIMARRSDRRVAIVTHSQGGLEARWALRWWPDLRSKVSDLVMLVPPNQGSVFTDATCGMPSVCAAALYQMRSDSNFLAALNSGRQVYRRVAMTSIGTTADTVFVQADHTPVPASGRTVSNVTVQDLCAQDQPQHNDMPFDGPTYAIVTDALDHPGPADLDRIGPSACEQQTMPGVDRAYAVARLAAYSATLVELLGPTGPKAPGEPGLAGYAR